nr:MAG TPA: hypothetical protein [Caudoviricetes sp.]
MRGGPMSDFKKGLVFGIAVGLARWAIRYLAAAL